MGEDSRHAWVDRYTQQAEDDPRNRAWLRFDRDDKGMMVIKLYPGEGPRCVEMRPGPDGVSVVNLLSFVALFGPAGD